MIRGSWRNVGKQTLRLLVAMALFNLPFALLGQWYFIRRPLVNCDGLFLALVAPLGWLAGGFLLIMTWFLDIAVATTYTFHFRSALDFVLSARFLDSLNLLDFLSLGTVLSGLICLVCGVTAIWLLRRKVGLVAILSVGIIAITCDIANGSFDTIPHDLQSTRLNIAGSALRILAIELVTKALSKPVGQMARLPESQSLVGQNGIRKWPSTYSERSVLFVIVESLGSHKSSAVRQWLRMQLVDARMEFNYDIAESTIQFKGATTDGEIRFLCGFSGQYGALSESLGRDCLPAQFALAGWTTHGFHGFFGEIFDRRRWWPLIGIQRMNFAEEILRVDDRRCGSGFRGACDADILHSLMPILTQPRQFVYLLTLNTHLPIERQRIPEDLGRLAEEVGRLRAEEW